MLGILLHFDIGSLHQNIFEQLTSLSMLMRNKAQCRLDHKWIFFICRWRNVRWNSVWGILLYPVGQFWFPFVQSDRKQTEPLTNSVKFGYVIPLLFSTSLFSFISKRNKLTVTPL